MKAGSALASILLALSVTACGGGGGGSSDSGATPSSVTSTASFPIAGAMATIAQSNLSYNLSGLDTDGIALSASFVQTPGAATSFEGNVVNANSQSVIIKKQGVVIDQVNQIDYVQPSPYLEVGTLDSDSNEYSVADIASPMYLPSTAKVGQSGSLNPATIYSSSSKSTALRKISRTWELDADTATTAYLCLNNVTTDLSSGKKFSESDCYLIDTSGVNKGLVVKLATSSGQLTLK